MAILFPYWVVRGSAVLSYAQGTQGELSMGQDMLGIEETCGSGMVPERRDPENA